MVQQWIAFLRAINVGGHIVKMDRLRSLFEALGFSNVESFIASGNIIFESADENVQALEKQIEQHLQRSLGYEVATFIRSPSELAAIADYAAVTAAEPDATGHSLYIGFLAVRPNDEAQRKLLDCRTDIDDFRIHGREVYWLCRKKISESTFSGARLEKTLGMPTTLRNVTTVRKLAAKYPAPSKG